MAEKTDVLALLKTLAAPGGKADIVEAGLVTGLVVKAKAIGFILEVDAATGAAAGPLRREAEELLKTHFPGHKISVVLTAPTSPARKKLATPAHSGLSRIKYRIAVASGKGGVGKSTVAVNLAAALSLQNLKVGLMDADIYGPSVPKMLGYKATVELTDTKMIRPLEAHGLKVMSMGFMVEEDAPLVWRGPMVMSAIRQMLHQVDWGVLDFLIVDLPPGTGDAQLSLSKEAGLSGAVIVSTPQDIALIDARKGIEMFRKVNVPILGLVENMSYYKCPSCGHEDHIFSHGGVAKAAAEMGVPLLAEIPLNTTIRELSDAGTPLVLAQPDHPAAAEYRDLAVKVSKQAARQENAHPSTSSG